MPKSKKRWGGASSEAQQPPAAAQPVAQSFRFLAVLDFEATCIRDGRIQPQEVIEFPIVLVDARNGQLLGEFHRYCRPLCHPQLSDFCTELTGIQQEWVDGAEPFAPVFCAAAAWLEETLRAELSQDDGEAPGSESWEEHVLLCTCGDWDLKTMLPAQCALIGEHVPAVFRRWANVKEVFRQHRGSKPSGMVDMLAALGVELVGRHHSGIADTRNIARCCQALLKEGALFDATSLGKGKGEPSEYAAAKGGKGKGKTKAK